MKLFAKSGIICLSLIALVLPCGMEAAEKQSPEVIEFGNSFLRVEFSARNGSLRSLKNCLTGSDYIRNDEGDQFLFRAFTNIDPLRLSHLHENAAPINVSEYQLLNHSLKRTGEVQMLTMNIAHREQSLRFLLQAGLHDRNDWLTLNLEVFNQSREAVRVMLDFPCLSGVQLGSAPEGNKGLYMMQCGTADQPAWSDVREIYGLIWTVQYDAVYDPAANESLGYIVADPDFGNKWFYRNTSRSMWVTHFPVRTIDRGQSFMLPAVRVMVCRGDWKPIALNYGQWYRDNFKVREVPDWFSEVNMYTGLHAPDWAYWTGYEAVPQMTDAQRASWLSEFNRHAFLGNQYDCKEFALFFDWRSSRQPYLLRPDLGTDDDLRKAVADAHRIGRYVLFYLGGVTYVPDAIDPDVPRDYWALKEHSGKEVCFYEFTKFHPLFGHRQASMCPGVGEWQDHLAQIAADMVALGADGIRLDELSYFGTCFNPAHRHESPFDWYRWVRQLVTKVRTSMDRVNPDAVLLTEHGHDYLAQWCDGALFSHHYGPGISPMRVSLPSYRYIAHDHPGAVDAALNGYIASRNTVRTSEFTHPRLPRPGWYPPGHGDESHWNELRSMFSAALTKGDVAAGQLLSGDDPNWTGTLFQSEDYWLVVGGHPDASLLPHPVRVTLKNVPEEIQGVWEFDAQTLAMKSALPERVDSKTLSFLATGGFSAFLLPKKTCPPVIRVSKFACLHPAREIEAGMERVSPWSSEADAGEVYFEIPGIQSRRRIEFDSQDFRITVPPETEPGFYYVRVSGQCLPLKKYFEVK